MVWGGNNDEAVENWVRQLTANDPKLRSLYILSMRCITPNDLSKIFGALATNTTLEELHCSGHALDTTAANSLAEALTLNSTLRTLNIGNAELGQDIPTIEILCEGLAENEGLHTLDFENKGFTAASVALLAKGLSKNKTLRELNLSRNALDDASSEVLAPVLKSHPSLRTLNLSMNHFGPPAADTLATSIASSHLSEVDLSGNPFKDSTQKLAAILSNNSHLRTLKMADVSGLLDTLEPLPAAAQDGVAQPDPAPHIETSETSAQPDHGDKLVRAIADVLPTSQLTHLCVGNNAIGGEAISYLAEQLPKSRLEMLDLKQNMVGDTGACALAKCLKITDPTRASCKLRHVELDENEIGGQGLGELLDTPLAYVGLCGNHVGGFGADAALLPDLSTSGIVKLDIGCNKVSVQDMKAIVELLVQGGAPDLESLEMGGNAEDNEMPLWEEEVATLQTQRPTIAVTWKRRSGEEPPPMA